MKNKFQRIFLSHILNISANFRRNFRLKKNCGLPDEKTKLYFSFDICYICFNERKSYNKRNKGIKIYA